MKQRDRRTHVLVQQLPREPESFIHLDMVFTFLDREARMIYEPVILNRHDFQTVHIVVDNGEVAQIFEEQDLPAALDRLGPAMEAIRCGGGSDSWIQEREQWHSGADFLALAPGQVVGYSRNQLTLLALDEAEFEIIPAEPFLSGTVQPVADSRFVIAVEGSELSRRGGGCRCMTMPLRRASVAR